MNEKRQFTAGALLSYCSIAFSVAAGLLYTPWLIRTVGDHGYGIYTLALSVVNFFLLDLGIGSAVARFLAGYDARGRSEEAARFLGVVYQVLGFLAVVIALCLAAVFLLSGSLYPQLNPNDLTLFRRILATLGLYSVIAFPFGTFGGILSANQRFAELRACELGQKVLSVVLIVAALKLGRGVLALAVAHVFTGGVFLLVKYAILRKKTGHRASLRGWDRGCAADLWHYSRWVAVMNLAHRCIFNVMPSVIALFTGSAEVTLFALAAALEGYLYTAGEAVNGMFLPRLSRLLAVDSGREEAAALTLRAGTFQIWVVGLPVIGFACLGREFVALWLGPGYEPVYWCALLLMSPGVISIPQQSARSALLAAGHVREQALVCAAAAVLNVVLAFVLVPVWGVTGGAVSVCAVCLVRVVGMNLLYRRQLSMDLPLYFRRVFARWLPGGLAALAAGLAAARFLPLSGWGGLAVKALLICAVYGLFLLPRLSADRR